MEKLEFIQDIEQRNHKISYSNNQMRYILNLLSKACNTVATIKPKTYSKSIGRDLFCIHYATLINRILKNNNVTTSKGIYKLKLTRMEACLILTTVIPTDYHLNDIAVIVMQLEKSLNLKLHE